MTLPLLPGASELRECLCGRPVPKGPLVHGYGSGCARQHGLLPPRRPRVPRMVRQDGPDLLDLLSEPEPCLVRGCEEAIRAKGLCRVHYFRNYRRGTTDPSPRTLSLVERFWSHVDKSSDCWVWTGARNHQGYGRFGIPGRRTATASRFSYELHAGPIPVGLFVCHHCDNPPCVRPDHLFLGDYVANALDMVGKGRRRGGARGGEAHHMVRLTEDDVQEIRRLAATLTRKAIARRFGVSAAHVSKIVLGKVWK